MTRLVPTGLAAGLAAGLLLAGCSSEQPLVAEPPADSASHPVVVGKQATAVLDKVDAALASPTGDPARVIGPYLQIRTAQRRQAAVEKRTLPAPAVPERTRLLVPSTLTWPRFFVAVGPQGGSPTPTLRVLVSPQARQPYGLWAELTMLPGAVLPEVAPAGDGAPALGPAEASGLPLSPVQALVSYAESLTAGPGSPQAERFAENAFSAQVTAQQRADSTGLAKVATVTVRHSVLPGTTYAVRTADGGAIVVGQLVQKVSIVVKPGAGTVKVSDPGVAALAGRSVFSKAVVRQSAEVVALHVPAEAGEPITVIAAQKADLTVDGT